eukprot:14389128-Alexandrium_andersonii.AAC.1
MGGKEGRNDREDTARVPEQTHALAWELHGSCMGVAWELRGRATHEQKQTGSHCMDVKRGVGCEGVALGCSGVAWEFRGSCMG